MINRMYVITLLSVLPFTACGSAQGGEKTEAPEVYFIREITPRNMVRIYEAQERPATGKVAVKLSTGEPDGHNYLKPEQIKEIVTKVGGTIVECNTAYGGGRAHTEAHLKAAADHGFTAIAPVDIMDADGEVSLPVKGGRHLKENFVGSHYPRYDFTVVLSHFKGHAMGGFGGAVKNISIGIASSAGKAWIHSAGKTKNAAEMWSDLPAQDDFLESMAESAKSVADHCGDRILHISVMNNLFGGGMSSRLFQRIREEMGAAYSVYSFPSTYTNCGTFTVYAGTSPETAQQVADELLGQIRLRRDGGVTQEEFDMAKEQLKVSYVLGLESSSARMSAIGRSKLLRGHAVDPQDVIRKIEAVTKEDVERVAHRMFGRPFSASAVGRNIDGLKLL